ncbi:MAG: hypothetical protein ACLQUY_22245 [Ktedonobacterales bacterium]
MTASVDVPRLAGIEHPENANVGRAGDYEGQLAVLRETLVALTEISTPGTVKYVPSHWSELDEKLDLHLLQSPPIVDYIKRHPWALPRFLRRNPPESSTF